MREIMKKVKTRDQCGVLKGCGYRYSGWGTYFILLVLCTKQPHVGTTQDAVNICKSQ